MQTSRYNPVTGQTTGKPSTYTSELGDKIALAVSSSHVGLDAICRANPDFPHHLTVREWMIKIPEFGIKYAKAKEAQAETLVDAILKVIDHPETYIDDSGRERSDAAMIRIKVDAFKWQAGKLRPRKYGERVAIESQSSLENEALKAEIASLRAQLALKSEAEY
ncbi:unnamed protein product [Sphagnum jensenii]|uniref:Terminase small subunit n=1 Tax=Sphagnum jensenii TaxID=128206 RepID=A0ABP0VG60_9BRYO